MAVKVRSRKFSFQVVYCNPIKGRLPSKVVFRQRSSSVKGRLPSKVVFRQRSSSIKGRLPSKVVFRQRLSSIKGRLPSKGFFHRRLSSSFESLLLGFSPECGIAHLSFSLFVSSSWSTSMTSIIFLFELVHLNDLFCDE